MKKKFLILSILAIATTSFAQHKVFGTVTDQNNDPLPYSSVLLLNIQDSTLSYYAVTNDDGFFQIKDVENKEYIIQYSFVGMETISESIKIPRPTGEDMGSKMLQPQSLDEIEVIAEYIPIQFKSDTVEFTGKSFEVKADAVVEDLLKKIPGVEVDESGNVKAMGEEVTKVLVDGKEFFGKDLKVATKNLPADAIKKVQVYDKKSEEAEFMGIDDGERSRTINLMLNEENRQGYFGNIKAGGGYGAKEHYIADGKLYRFSEKLQLAALGASNNINDFAYTSNKNNWGQQVDGLNTTHAGGLNLSYNQGKKNRYFISYLGSTSNKLLEQQSERNNFFSEKSYNENSSLNSETQNTPHKINLGIRHNFNEMNRLILDGDLDFSSNSLQSSLYRVSTQGIDSLNLMNNLTNSSSENINGNIKASFISKFSNEKTQFKADFRSVYQKNSEFMDWNNQLHFFQPISTETIHQYQDNNTENLSIHTNPSIVQEITPNIYLNTTLNLGYISNRLGRELGLLPDELQIDSLSTDFSTIRKVVHPELALNRTSGKSQFTLSLKAGIDQLEKNIQETNITPEQYVHFLPSVKYFSNYRKGRFLRLAYHTTVNMPTTSQLLPVSNVLNPLSVYTGNMDLEPEYKHDVFVNWSIFDQFSFTSLFIRGGASLTKNKFSLSETIHDDYSRSYTPINVENGYRLNSSAYFSTPFRPLGIKINLSSSEVWTQSTNLVNDQENTNTNMTHSLKLSVENRKKEKWDVLAGASLGLTKSQYSLANTLNNTYFNTRYFTELRFTPNDKWNIEADAKMINYNSKSLTESVSMPLLGASISHYFLSGEKASITLSAIDILNKSENIKQLSGENYIMQQSSNTLGRIFLLSLKFRIGN